MFICFCIKRYKFSFKFLIVLKSEQTVFYFKALKT